MRTIFLISGLFALLMAAGEVPAGAYGAFSGPIKAEWLEDGRKMRLLEAVVYTDPNGLVWTAKQGSVVDGASIPDLLWSVVGSPFSGKYRDASVIHDVACQERSRTWEAVHLAFYYAMRASGVPETNARVMYGAVYHFGPRWRIGEVSNQSPVFGGLFGGLFGGARKTVPEPGSLAREDFDRLKQAIETGQLDSLEAIRDFQ